MHVDGPKVSQQLPRQPRRHPTGPWHDRGAEGLQFQGRNREDGPGTLSRSELPDETGGWTIKLWGGVDINAEIDNIWYIHYIMDYLIIYGTELSTINSKRFIDNDWSMDNMGLLQPIVGNHGKGKLAVWPLYLAILPRFYTGCWEQPRQ